MPYTTRADGDVVTASSWNATVRDQVISTVTAATRPGGTEGQVIAETDTDLFQAYTGSAWVPNGGYGVWTSYTPTLTQSGAVTKNVTYARYQKHGRMVVANFYLGVTGTGTANAAITVSLPFAASSTSVWTNGTGIIYDSSATTIFPCMVSLPSSSTTSSFTDSTNSTTIGIYMGMTGTLFNVALASGDVIAFGITYESAS